MPETRKLQRPVTPTANNDADDLPRGNCFNSDDPDLFFSNDFQDQARAALICSTCPLRNDCAAVALERGEHGVWGGTTEADRNRLTQGRPAIRSDLCRNQLHPRTEANTRINVEGIRICRPCRAEVDRARKQRDRDKRNARDREKYAAAKAKEMSA